MMKELSVIIPAYNEEGNIEKAVQKCLEVLPKLVERFEIVVVDDGSRDRTGEIAERIAKSFEEVKVFHHEKNKGMGAGVATGFTHAKYDLLFATSADLQFDIGELGKLLALIGGADIVAAYRVSRNYSWYRWMITYVNIFLLRLLFGLKVKDPNWVKLFRREVFSRVKITSSGFFWDAEVLIKAKKQGLRIAEVGVHSYTRKQGKASGASPKAAVKTFFALVKFWLTSP